MALNETQRQNLSKLDVMDGTGIFTNNTKVDSVDQPTVIISLGGLGGKTLNKLKNQIKRRVNKENNSIRLLAIDSAESDMEQLLSYGNLTKDEILSLYDPTIPAMAAKKETIPSFIHNWLNEDFIPSITGQGCGGVRQNGRFILAVPAVYNKVRNRVKEVILSAKDAAPLGRINVIFIAGISGGTGSGTFIDMAYLVQDILKTDIGMATKSSYNMSAYLYMPDVQFGNGANSDALKRNGYAALKELDYFYNLNKVDGVYEWPFSEGSIKNSSSNIYDFCTLVSSYAAGGIVGKDAEEMAINVTVESLMAIITNAELTDKNGQPQQILTSFLDNYETNIEEWMIAGNGSQVELFPRSTNYRYNVIGYGSARIPVDAIMSYIALEMYENMLDEYHNMNSLNADYISKLMVSVGAGDMDSIINAVKDISQCSYNPSELPSGGDIHGVKNSYKAWRDKAIEHYITYKNTQPFAKAIDKVTASIISAFDTKLNATFGEQGQYFVSKAITASFAGDGVDGVLRKLDALIKAMGDEYDNRIERCISTDRLIAALDQKAADVPSILGIVKQEDRDSYLYTAKSTIEKFTVESEILLRMQDKLVEVRNFLVDSNNKVFDVYTNVLDYIKEILAKNSDLVVKSSRTSNVGGGETYSLDVVNLDVAQENGKRLKSCLDSFLTPEFLAKFKNAFEEILRAPENRLAFTDTTDKFNATKLIQKLFDSLLGQFYREAVERFLIAYYSDSQDMDNIEKLDSVMNDENEKKKALMLAANAICKELQHNAKPLCQIIGGAIEQFAEPQKYMCCPSILYDIFVQVAPAYFPNGIKLCKRDNAFSVDVVTSHIGIPLAKIHGINDADVAYDQAITSKVMGLHLDENSKSDFKMLPAPFIREAWSWVVGEHKSAVETNNIFRVEKLTKKLIEQGLIETDTDAEGRSNNARVKTYFEGEIPDNLIAAFTDKAKYEVNPMTVNADFIGAFLTANGVNIQQLPIKINEKGLVSSMENLNIIVRKNVILFRKLEAFLNKYEKLNQIVDEQKKGGNDEFEFNNNVTAFTNLIKTGLVKYNPNFRCWNYFDGTMEKPLYSFGMRGPFETAYNMYFVFAEYVLKIDSRLKEGLNALVMEKFNNQQVNFAMPEEIKADIDKLFTPGAPNTAPYLLDRELNRAGVNQGAAMLTAEFGIPLPKHNDSFEALMKFYNAIRANFN